MSVKNFVGISAEISNGVITKINTSSGHQIENSIGIPTLDVIAFLHNLSYQHKKTIYVCYNFQIANEHIFSSLSKTVKSELLLAFDVRKEIDELTKVKEDLQAKWFNKRLEMSEGETVEVYNELAAVSNALNQSGHIILGDYKIELAQGKQLNIKKDKKTFVLYDVYGFFREPLKSAITTYLHQDDESIRNLAALKGKLAFEAESIAKLTSYVYLSFQAHGIKLNSFHGAGAITSAILNQTKARNEYKPYKSPEFTSGVIHKAVTNSFYGGRVEQCKLGRIENINAYDLNSAYAAASVYLPRMLNRPTFTREYNDTPFSCWLVEYDLPKHNYFGLLPFRDMSQIPVYKRRGKGYYWQPEVKFLLEHYQDYIKITDGFYVPDNRVNFSRAITDLYELRKELKANGNPLEAVIKLALAIFYGKFCQTVGQKKHYYNLFYAGFMTSYTRAELLKATHGFERETICFSTDAVHTTAKLNLPLSDKLGEWRHKSFDVGYYFGAGIYDLHGKDENGKTIRKQARRGFTEIDFDAALSTLKATGTYTAIKEFFIGHNLHVFDEIEFSGYLLPYKKTFNINPLESKTRLFKAFGANIGNITVESELVDTNSGLLSSDYQAHIPNDIVMKFDAASVGKI